MNFEIPNYLLALPEMTLLGMACFVLVLDLFLSEKHRIVTFLMSQLALILPAIMILNSFSQDTQLAFSDTYVRDPMGDVLKLMILLAVLVVFIYARPYLTARKLFKGEFFVLGLFGTLGMMVMVSAHSLLTIYLGLELLSLSMYAMVALQRDSMTASESAMKYFILGALASGMLLYGISMLYGATASLDLGEIQQSIILSGGDDIVLVFALVFIVVGLAFKLGAVPFHMWVPDVYHGAPTAVTLFIGSAPKIAAFAMVMRLLVDGLSELHQHWQAMLIILVILSIAVGNIVAIAQTNIKRMLAYSTIAHVGYLMLGVVTGTESGYAASMFYTIVYAMMSLGGFGMILLLSRAGFESDELHDLKGLNERSPWYAFMMLILMFSMAGVPPFLGFWAKVSVLSEVINSGYVWLAIYAVVLSIIGAFYYLRIIKLMYFDKPEQTAQIESPMDVKFVLSLNALGILALGLFPGGLLSLCRSALMM